MAKLKNEELKAKIDNKRLKNTANQQIEIKTKTAPNIKVYEKYFICNNFEGACSYKIFDIFGRKLQEGTAHNNIEIEIRHKTTGTYLIQATDNKGNVETQKIIIKQQ